MSSRDFFLFLIIDFLGNSTSNNYFNLRLISVDIKLLLQSKREATKFSKIFIKSNDICQQTVSSLGQSEWKTCTYDVMDVERMLSPVGRLTTTIVSRPRGWLYIGKHTGRLLQLYHRDRIRTKTRGPSIFKQT